MAAKYPQREDSPEAREGTAAHHLLAARLVGEVLEVGDMAPNGHPVTAEMFECTDAFVGDVEAYRIATPDLEERTETRVYMPQVHSSKNWGTADWFGVSRANRIVVVKDYKHGHRFVEAWGNWQLVDYGAGVVNAFGIEDMADWTFIFDIYQPRSYSPEGPVKSWSIPGPRFLDHVAQLREAANDAMAANPGMHTGKHCSDCEGNIHCPAFRQAAENGIDLSLRGAPEEMDADAKGTFRTMVADAIKRLEGIATGLDADIEAAIRGGGVVPGWQLKPKETRLAWTAPMEQVYALGDLYGIDVRKPDAITPTQAIKKGIDETVISEYAKRPPAGFKVAPSDKTAAAKAFK